MVNVTEVKITFTINEELTIMIDRNFNSIVNNCNMFYRESIDDNRYTIDWVTKLLQNIYK